ncbi:MAG: nitrile hydratase accessory protein [Gammaproteobacteria bacterium]
MALDTLAPPGIPCESGEGPVFDKPWQAQAFSLVVNLHRAGLFEWRDWAERFSAEIAAAPARADESVNDAYYRQWVAALEKLLATLGVVGDDSVAERAAAWNQAYLNTPHGQPVTLVNADCPPPHDHSHEPRREPVKVVPAGGD